MDSMSKPTSNLATATAVQPHGLVWFAVSDTAKGCRIRKDQSRSSRIAWNPELVLDLLLQACRRSSCRLFPLFRSSPRIPTNQEPMLVSENTCWSMGYWVRYNRYVNGSQGCVSGSRMVGKTAMYPNISFCACKRKVLSASLITNDTWIVFTFSQPPAFSVSKNENKIHCLAQPAHPLERLADGDAIIRYAGSCGLTKINVNNPGTYYHCRHSTQEARLLHI
ncbi:hypothetical protein B0T13DRAFT_472834 [Neurospora crassa]|nr:hypothetical protein B0T13DRAFT_472834 [Neurospora crassa]